jgi:hypothetical protein
LHVDAFPGAPRPEYQQQQPHPTTSGDSSSSSYYLPSPHQQQRQQHQQHQQQLVPRQQQPPPPPPQQQQQQSQKLPPWFSTPVSASRMSDASTAHQQQPGATLSTQLQRYRWSSAAAAFFSGGEERDAGALPEWREAVRDIHSTLDELEAVTDRGGGGAGRRWC